MVDVTLSHFKRAAIDIGKHGDNDTLPFDIDTKFIKENSDKLADVAHRYFVEIDSCGKKNIGKAIGTLQIFSERLLVPTGPAGFRVTTKLHPFWNAYLNGLGVAIAEKNEPNRSKRAHSYRYISDGDGLFDRDKSWRAYKEATLADEALEYDEAVVVQTDVSSFYEHIYHHRLENCINDLFSDTSTVGKQVDRILNKIAAGRSFGLPVGGQCARILAELLMSSIDQRLNDLGIAWHRYVDDFTLIVKTQEGAYEALSNLSHILADYGLSLNRSKTTILSAKHYIDYVNTQLGTSDLESQALREIDLRFDPYSDSSVGDYSELKQTVQKLDVQALLNLELRKAQPETFLVTQISRTLRFHSPLIARQLCSTLLCATNLHAFRASWSTIMKGITSVRNDDENKEIFEDIDGWLDEIPDDSPHLLKAEANCLHYLRAIRFKRTVKRARFVLETYKNTNSETVKRACIECWKDWKDRPNILHMRNSWENLSAGVQRMLWLAFYSMGDEGYNARTQLKNSLSNAWALGIEGEDKVSFSDIYLDWAKNGV